MITGQELKNALYLLSTHNKAEAIRRAGDDEIPKAIAMFNRCIELDSIINGIDRNKQYQITEISQEQE